MTGNGSNGDDDDRVPVIKHGRVSVVDDDDDLTPIIHSIVDPRNREMLAILGNYLLESKEHTLRLEALYGDLRQLPYLAHHIWSVKVLELFERHHSAMSENLEDLREYVRKGA